MARKVVAGLMLTPLVLALGTMVVAVLVRLLSMLPLRN